MIILKNQNSLKRTEVIILKNQNITICTLCFKYWLSKVEVQKVCSWTFSQFNNIIFKQKSYFWAQFEPEKIIVYLAPQREAFFENFNFTYENFKTVNCCLLCSMNYWVIFRYLELKWSCKMIIVLWLFFDWKSVFSSFLLMKLHFIFYSKWKNAPS